MKKLNLIDEPVSSTNKTDRHNITEILLKVALNTINLTITPNI
jgi:ABC-type taurine transport system ATPase subunit